jgi:DNA-binding XRE family transcriptional regulator
MSGWRDNPTLVYCYENFVKELQAIKNNEPYFFYGISARSGMQFRRKQLGITQAQLAIAAGVSRCSVNMGECNKIIGDQIRLRINTALASLEDEADLRMAAE